MYFSFCYGHNRAVRFAIKPAAKRVGRKQYGDLRALHEAFGNGHDNVAAGDKHSITGFAGAAGVCSGVVEGKKPHVAAGRRGPGATAYLCGGEAPRAVVRGARRRNAEGEAGQLPSGTRGAL